MSAANLVPPPDLYSETGEIRGEVSVAAIFECKEAARKFLDEIFQHTDSAVHCNICGVDLKWTGENRRIPPSQAKLHLKSSTHSDITGPFDKLTVAKARQAVIERVKKGCMGYRKR